MRLYPVNPLFNEDVPAKTISKAVKVISFYDKRLIYVTKV